jgi:uncharacterized protein YrrD
LSTRIDLNAKVRTRDGEDAGSIERAILDPSGTWVREFVVDTGGLLGRPVLVPSAEVEASARDGDVLRLRLSKTELDRLPTYVPERYVAPPMTWVPPVGLGFPEGSYLWPAALVDTSAPGTVAPSTAASTATPTSSDRDRVVRPDDGDVGISRDAVVLDRDGNDVGVVDEVRIDPATDAVMGFMLRVGGLLGTLFGRGEKVEVTRSQIDHVNEGVVQLRLTKDELERLAKQATTR